jgi:hypothetical protein
MPGVFNDQALFDAKVAELEEQRLNPEPEAAVEEVEPEPVPDPEPELCPDFTYNTGAHGYCQHEGRLTKLCLRCDHFPRHDLEGPDTHVDNRCHNFMENYGGYSHGSCYEADKAYCPNCSNYPREKWIYTQSPSSWTDSEAQQFLETFNIHVKMGTSRWEIDNAIEDILRVIKAVAQVAAAPKDTL